MNSVEAGTHGNRKRVLRVGLVGLGPMGIQHARAILRAKQARLVGLADPVASAGDLKLALPVGVDVVADLPRLIENSRPEVVHIVTPPATHFALAAQALEAGCHVYVEKPFTPTLAEARQLVELACRRDLRIVAGHQVLFETPAIKAEAIQPLLGKLVHAESHFSFRQARRSLAAIDQCKDILPHAVYPLLKQLRAADPAGDAPIRIAGVDARSTGDLYALLSVGEATGIIEVTLSGRPIEQYQQLIGTNGSLRIDYITGSTVHLSGTGAGVGVLFTPYRRAFQTIFGATRGFSRLLLRRQGSYPGLAVLIDRFYDSVLSGSEPPVSAQDILDTVDVCERLGGILDESGRAFERAAEARGTVDLERLPAVRTDRPAVLVTGGTGFLGRCVAQELCRCGFATRVVARSIPAASSRIAGVEYVAADLAKALPPGVLQGIEAVVHCAAETSGGKSAQERNSILATRNVTEALLERGISRLVYVSSLAVLRPSVSRAALIDESAVVDAGNLSRGPYVWGKAQAELEVTQMAAAAGLAVKIVRPGPLVDFGDFSPPGRLGREVGPWFVAMGSRSAPLSVCDTQTAARVIRSYLDAYDSAPPVLNLIEASSPSREQLVSRLKARRPELRIIWVPDWFLRLVSWPAKAAQWIFAPASAPVDIYQAFATERYQSSLAASVIVRAAHRQI